MTEEKKNDIEKIKLITKELNDSGWTLTSSNIKYPQFKYNSKDAVTFAKEQEDCRIEVTVANDRKFVIMYIQPSKEDAVYQIGEFVYDLNKINVLADHQFQGANISIESLREQYESLQYFDPNLNMKDKNLLLKALNDSDLQLALSTEMMFVNKIQTITRNRQWIIDNKRKGRDYHAGHFKRVITNPASQADPFGNISGWGMKMTIKEYSKFEELHDELFNFEEIDDKF